MSLCLLLRGQRIPEFQLPRHNTLLQGWPSPAMEACERGSPFIVGQNLIARFSLELQHSSQETK